MEDTMANVILTELREFREENNKRWIANDERWEQNEKRWEENDKRWEENDKKWNETQQILKENSKKWEENDKKWNENTKILGGINERLTALEEGRKKDRLDLIDILDTMEKSISNQFNEMKEYFDAKFEKVYVTQKVNDMEHAEFKKLVCAHQGRLDFYNARINKLEEWKEQFDMGEFTAV